MNDTNYLYPALQKFYNALCCLERFNKGQSLFDNVSNMDSFFTEYRNITFVLKCSLSHTDYLESYENVCQSI